MNDSNSKDEASGRGLDASASRAQKRLIKKIHAHHAARRAAMQELFGLYAAEGEDEGARSMAMLLLREYEGDPPGTAAECLGLGVQMERARRYDLAAWLYAMGVRHEPTEEDIWYWLNNNLGYSLNQMGEFTEAEYHCRAAIRCEPRRHNGHKNLGVALEGLGRYAEAARCYVIAANGAPWDLRAAEHLVLLARTHRGLIEESVPEAVPLLERYKGLAEIMDGPPQGEPVPGPETGGPAGDGSPRSRGRVRKKPS